MRVLALVRRVVIGVAVVRPVPFAFSLVVPRVVVRVILVRMVGPLWLRPGRRATEIQPGDDAVTVQVTASRQDAARLREMLQKQGGV